MNSRSPCAALAGRAPVPDADLTSIKARARDRSRLRRTMRTGRPKHYVLTATWRCFWRAAGVLLVFAQAAVAADQCLPARVVGERAALVLAVVYDHHDLDAHCVGDLVTPDQAPASEAKRLAPDPGVSAPATWDASPDAGQSWPVSYALARAGPSLRLQFRNLRL